MKRFQTNRGMSTTSIIIIILIAVIIAFIIFRAKNSNESGAMQEENATDSTLITPGQPISNTPTAIPAPSGSLKEATPTTKKVTIKLLEQNGSRQSGEAVLTDLGGGKTEVLVTLTGKASEVAEPSHIHSGTCEKSGPITYPLSDIKNGSAKTVLTASLAEITKNLPIYLNVHKSAAELQTSVACGAILKPTPPPVVLPTTPATSADRFTVRYTSSGFNPKTVEIKAGESIKFVNDSSNALWVASNPHPIHNLYPGFDEGKSVSKGGTFIFTFTDVGSWSYHNHNKPGDGGTIIVK